METLKARERKTRRAFIVLSMIASIVSILVNFVLFTSADVLIIQGQRIGQVFLLIGTVLNICSIPLMHLTGKILHDNYRFYQPFVGGSDFVRMQAIAWILYAAAICLVGQCMIFHSHEKHYISLSGNMFSVSQVLISCSLLMFNLDCGDRRVLRSESGDVTLGTIKNDLWHTECKYNLEFLLKIDCGTYCFLLFTTLNLVLLGIPLLNISLSQEPISANQKGNVVACTVSAITSFWITNKIGFKLYSRFNGGSFLRPFFGGYRFLLLDAAVWSFLLFSAISQIRLFTNLSHLGYMYFTSETSVSSLMAAHLCLLLSIRFFEPLRDTDDDNALEQINTKAAKFSLRKLISLDEKEQKEFIEEAYRDMSKFNEQSVGGIATFAIIVVFSNIHYFLFVFLFVGFQLTNFSPVGVSQEKLLNAFYCFAINFAITTILNIAIAMLKLPPSLAKVIFGGTFLVPMLWSESKLRNSSEWTIYLIWSGIYFLYLNLTHRNSPEFTGSRSSRFLMNLKLWDTVGEYFGFDLLLDKKAEATITDDLYIIAFHPHGILPATLAWLPLTTAFKRMFPSIVARGHTASVLHYVPGLRDLSQLLGMRDVYRHTVERSIDEGVSPLIAVGGQKEMFLSSSSGNKIKLYAGHKGFIRLAVKKQVPILPVFSFGEHLLLDNVEFPKVQDFMKNLFGFPIPFFPVGRFGLPIHRRSKLTVCVGQPLYPRLKREEATEEHIDRLHKAYLNLLHEIFERNKSKCGFKDTCLEFCS